MPDTPATTTKRRSAGDKEVGPRSTSRRVEWFEAEKGDG